MADPLLRATEDQIQAAIVQLMLFRGHERLMYHHVPNGLPSTPRAALRFKRLGMQPGVADLSLTLPDGRTAFLEVKRPTGRLSPEQKAFQQQCERLGVPYAVVRSSEEAEAVLRNWGALKGPRHAS